jgi:hypothetical protein
MIKGSTDVEEVIDDFNLFCYASLFSWMMSTFGKFFQEGAKVFGDRFSLRPSHLFEEEVEVEWDRRRIF